MPDYSFIAQPQTSSGLQSLSSIVNSARGITDLIRARATMQADIERARAESALAQTEAGVAAQTAQPRIEQQAAVTSQAQTGARAASFKLEGEQSAKAMQIASGLTQDPRIQKDDPSGIIDAANEAYSQMVASGIPKATADFWASQVKAQAHQPGGALRLLSNITRSAAGPAATAGVINAPVSLVQTPSGAIAPVQTQPGAPGAISPVPISSLQPGASGAAAAPAPAGVIPAGIPPAQREQATTDALGRPAIAAKDDAGQITYKAPAGSNYRPLMTLPAGETPETVKPLLALRDTAQAAAAAVPAQHFNNRQILDLADSAFTGTGSQELSRILNAYGARSSDNAASDTVKLQHFIALQIEQNAAAQGANTDHARQMAAQAVLPNSTPAQALKAITKVNDAYATGAELFNKAMQATLQNPGNAKDVFAIRDLQNAWAANMDPRIFQLENAVKAGDKREVEALKAALGPQGVNELLHKARVLKRLVDSGAVGGP